VRIVISGASGFLGSWIARVLSHDHEVIALVRDSSNLYKLSQIEKLEIVQLELSAWSEFLKRSQCDVLILNDWSGVMKSSQKMS
jgi:nucleoside-diphosphate-sugar epimerase